MNNTHGQKPEPILWNGLFIPVDSPLYQYALQAQSENQTSEAHLPCACVFCVGQVVVHPLLYSYPVQHRHPQTLSIQVPRHLHLQSAHSPVHSLSTQSYETYVSSPSHEQLTPQSGGSTVECHSSFEGDHVSTPTTTYQLGAQQGEEIVYEEACTDQSMDQTELMSIDGAMLPLHPVKQQLVDEEATRCSNDTPSTDELTSLRDDQHTSPSLSRKQKRKSGKGKASPVNKKKAIKEEDVMLQAMMEKASLERQIQERSLSYASQHKKFNDLVFMYRSLFVLKVRTNERWEHSTFLLRFKTPTEFDTWMKKAHQAKNFVDGCKFWIADVECRASTPEDISLARTALPFAPGDTIVQIRAQVGSRRHIHLCKIERPDNHLSFHPSGTEGTTNDVQVQFFAVDTKQ